MLNKVITNLLFLVFLLSVNISGCFAKVKLEESTMQLGDIIQYGDSSMISVDTTGQVTFSGIFNTITNVDNAVTFVDDSGLDFYIDVLAISETIPNITFDDIPGCKLEIKNITPNNTNSVALTMNGSGNYTFGFNATFTGTCEVGTYTRNITIPYLSCSYFFLSGACTPTNKDETASIRLSFNITEPLAVSEVKALDFGKTLVLSGSGTVTVSPTSEVSKTGNILTVSSTGASAGEWKIVGIGQRMVNIKLPQSPITIYSGTNEMTVSNFTTTNETVQLWGYSDNYEAEENFYVGGTLNINNGQAEGVYTGNYTVEVNYVE